MTGHFNQLTPAQAERLAILSEELGEVQQVIGKIQRHGYNSSNPNGGPPNSKLLHLEVGDVFAAVDRMCQAGDLSRFDLMRASAQKLARANQYLHHQEPPSQPVATEGKVVPFNKSRT